MVSHRIVIVGKNRMSRDGLKQIISDQSIEVIGDARSLSEASSLLRERGGSADLLLYDQPNCSSFDLSEMRQIIDAFPDIRAVILFGDGSRSDPVAAIASGVRGFLSNSISAEILNLSIRLILLQEGMFTCIVPKLPTRDAVIHTEFDGNFPFQFSEREISILQLLKQGASNNQMASDLVLPIGTVKFYVQMILRKIKVSNRTQAAIWAIENDGSRWEYASARGDEDSSSVEFESDP
jgi:two-component system, NarL family, nitrate/nitrite response regulator NarL